MTDRNVAGASSDSLLAGVHHRIEDGRAFVVLAGRATVEFDDGDALIYLRRGSMCALPPMASTRWTVAERIQLLAVTEAAVVFKERGESLPGSHADPAERPFRPRRHVS